MILIEGEGWRKREGKRRIEMGEKENQGRQKERKKKGRKEKEREKASRGQEGISPPPRKKKKKKKKKKTTIFDKKSSSRKFAHRFGMGVRRKKYYFFLSRCPMLYHGGWIINKASISVKTLILTWEIPPPSSQRMTTYPMRVLKLSDVAKVEYFSVLL